MLLSNFFENFFADIQIDGQGKELEISVSDEVHCMIAFCNEITSTYHPPTNNLVENSTE